MTALIIEDELPAARRLERLLRSIDPYLHILGPIDSVEASLLWFAQNAAPDLVLLDVHLADGQSFAIFEKLRIESFVIFTTAYDAYALRAFELNSVDYLLKPIDQAKLALAYRKFERMRASHTPQGLEQLLESLRQNTGERYRSHFLVQGPRQLLKIETDDIVFFYGEAKSNFVLTTDNREWPIDYSLDKLEAMLDPQQFFRISRQHLVNFRFVRQISYLEKGRLRIETPLGTRHELVVSAARVGEFKTWLER